MSITPHDLSLFRVRSLGREVGLSLIEARPPVILVFGLRFLTGGITSADAHPASFELHRGLVGQAGWLVAVWAIYLLNGVTDVREDRLNGSKRPIASGRLMSRRAAAICMFLGVSALALSALGGWTAMVPMLVLIGLGAAYSLGSRAAKRRGWIALAIAALAASLSYVGGSLSYTGNMSAVTWVIAIVLGGWIIAAGASKDLSDMDGDAASGRRTLPIIVGFAPACRCIAWCAVSIGIVGLAAGLAVPDARALMLLAPAAMAVAWSALRTRQDAERHVRRHPYRVFMFTQYGMNVALSGVALLS